MRRKTDKRRVFWTVFHVLTVVSLFLLLVAAEVHVVLIQKDLDQNTEYLSRCLELMKGVDAR